MYIGGQHNQKRVTTLGGTTGAAGLASSSMASKTHSFRIMLGFASIYVLRVVPHMRPLANGSIRGSTAISCIIKSRRTSRLTRRRVSDTVLYSGLVQCICLVGSFVLVLEVRWVLHLLGRLLNSYGSLKSLIYLTAMGILYIFNHYSNVLQVVNFAVLGSLVFKVQGLFISFSGKFRILTVYLRQTAPNHELNIQNLGFKLLSTNA